jgi:hypothetical protein
MTKMHWLTTLRPKTSSQFTVHWPGDLLPSTIPRAKIWVYGYNADVIGGLFQANNKNNILKHGNDFMVKVERALDDNASVRAIFAVSS